MKEIKVTDRVAEIIEMYRDAGVLDSQKAAICDLITNYFFEQQADAETPNFNKFMSIITDYVELLNELSKGD